MDFQEQLQVNRPVSIKREQIAQFLISVTFVSNIVDRFFANVISNTQLNNYGLQSYWPITFATVFIMILKELIYPNLKFSDFFYAAIVIFMIFEIHAAQQSWLIASFLNIFAARNLNIYKLVKTSFFTIFILTIFSMIGGVLGKFRPIQFIGFDNGNSFTNLFGMIYFSYISHILMFLTITYTVLYQQKLSSKKIFLLWLLNLFLFLMTDTSNSFMVVTIYLIGLLAIQKKKISFRASFAITVLPLISIFILFICIAIYKSGSSLGQALNQLVTTRLALSYAAINNFGIHSFSNLFQVYAHGYTIIIGGTYSYIDSAYILYLLRFGLVFFILWIFGIIFSIITCFKQKYVIGAWAAAAISIHAMFDPEILWTEFNPLIIMLAFAISQGRATFEAYPILKDEIS